MATDIERLEAERDNARMWACALEMRLQQVRTAIVETGARGVRWGDLRQRLAPRLLAVVDAPLPSPAAGEACI